MWILLDSVQTERECNANSHVTSDVTKMGGLPFKNLAVCHDVFTIALRRRHLKAKLFFSLNPTLLFLRGHLSAISLSKSLSFLLSLNRS